MSQHCNYSATHRCENEAGLNHFICHGEIQGCAGCCQICLNKDACEYRCAYAKTALQENKAGITEFDFSALGDLSVQASEADAQFNLHYSAAQDEYLISCIYLAKIHALTAKAGRYGGGTWTKWYESKGLGEGSVRRMIQNGEAFKSANMADLKQLPELTRKDLNLIARNGCAKQLAQVAGDSQRVQELLDQLKAEKERADSAESRYESAITDVNNLAEANSGLMKTLEKTRKDLRGTQESYPDHNNHHIDAVRYAMESVWRMSGQ